MGATYESLRPSAERRVALSHIGQSRARSMDQLPAQVFVAALADPEQLWPELDLEWNKRELERKKALRGNMFAKINDVDEYETKVAQDQVSIQKAETDRGIAALEADRSERQLDLKRIKSPVNGVVTERKHAPGEYVYDQTPLMSIAELDPLYVELVIPASHYGSVKVGVSAELHLNAPIGGAYSAKVQVVDPMIDAASNTFGVRLVLPNTGTAIPAGIRCAVRFPEAANGTQ